MATTDDLSPQDREARARFIRRWGVGRFGLPTAVTWAIVFFWWQHRPDFAWTELWSLEFVILLAIALVVMGWFGGRWWGARMYDTMRRKYDWRPPED